MQSTLLTCVIHWLMHNLKSCAVAFAHSTLEDFLHHRMTPSTHFFLTSPLSCDQFPATDTYIANLLTLFSGGIDSLPFI